MASWDIHTIGIIEWLEEYEGPRFHAILSDPPYALISIAKRFGPGQAPAQEGEDGRYQRLSSGFMGQTWDGFETLEAYQDWVAEWSTLLIRKALYPGAVCLFFGGTRTFHHLGVGLERGGFEIIDSVLIPWLHGQGFPKSHDIGKFLDKAAGEVREYVEGGIRSKSGKTYSKHGNYKEGQAVSDVPITEEAETWQGYGTALKPAWEPVYVCRAPRGDMTFAELAVQYGTGALNIDGSRIGDTTEIHTSKPRAERSTFEKGFVEGTETEVKDHGRWPANLVLTHNEACVKVGEYEVKGRTLNRYPSHGMGGSFAFYAEDHRGEDYESEKMPPDLVDLYACVPGCPVRELDDQAGLSGGGPVGSREGEASAERTYEHEGGTNFAMKPGARRSGADGPSRFFYTSKASRAEKDKGLEQFYWRRTNDGWERISEEEWAELDESLRGRGCIHPTVKPLALLRYLATLVLPPSRDEERRLLVPFSGSGSEMIAAMQAGWDIVEGVEMAETYTEMAEARIRATIGML